jgi:fructose-1-phosphate kinase PfkB-like protein
MTPVSSNQLELLRALVRHGVEFVVVGGVAAQVHGWQGATADLDIAVSADVKNVDRLNEALLGVGAGDGVVGGFGTAFRTQFGRLEIVRRADAIGDYAGWIGNAQPRQVEDGLTVVVASPDDILRSKEAAGREKDRAALPQMRRDFRDSGAI